MRGLMMDTPLLISSLLKHAATIFADQQIVTQTVEGPIHRCSYAEAHARSKRLANALTGLGVRPGDRVATIAWNTHRHFELYYAVSGMAAVCHTLNPRLHPSQVAYIVNHAEDQVVFVDLPFVPLVEQVIGHLPTVRHVVILTDRAHMPETTLPEALCYEDLLAGHSDDYDWPVFDENTASSLCYTSGTTGNPKGVLYSHRSTVLHAYAAALPDSFNLGQRDVALPVAPMFHVNAWGLPYVAPMTGARLVMPGPRLDGTSLHALMEAEGVTVAAGVPTVWLGLLGHMKQTGRGLPRLKTVIIGGAAAPRAMIEQFQKSFGIAVRHAWGMTEMSPLGTLSIVKPGLEDAPEDVRYRLQSKQGRPVFGVEMKIVDEQDKALPRDGASFGLLKVRGPWVCSAYYKDDRPALDRQGWLPTGDVSTIDADGYMNITDRAKDLIKSGGEWISSIDLENLAAGHPDVAQAAVIGIPDETWGERPLLIVVPVPGTEPRRETILAYLADKVADWWLPDDVVFADALPLGATGKVRKARLRETYRDHKPDVAGRCSDR